MPLSQRLTRLMDIFLHPEHYAAMAPEQQQTMQAKYNSHKYRFEEDFREVFQLAETHPLPTWARLRGTLLKG